MNTQQAKSSLRLFSFFLTVLLLVSGFLPFAPTKQVHAGVGTGNSGTINANGSMRGLGGGLEYVGDATFRVGISDDVKLKNDGDIEKGKTRMYEDAKNYIPTNEWGIYFAPYDHWVDNFTIGEYDPSTRNLVKMDKSTAKTLVYPLNAPIHTNPGNPGKTMIKQYFSDGDYTKLKNGGWKNYLGAVGKPSALNMWTYIFTPVSAVNNGQMGEATYDIVTRMNNVISPYAKDWGVKKLTEEQERDILEGYIGLLISTYRLLPEGNTIGIREMRKRWEVAIDNLLVHVNSKEVLPPSVLVIDPVVLMKWTNNPERMYFPAIDYQYFYNASHINYTLNGKINLGASAGDYYSMITSAVKQDVNANKGIYRISGNWDPNNAFAWGASAIDYPEKQLFTTRGNVHWAYSTSKAAFIDTLTYIKQGNKTLRGFVTANFYGAYNKKTVSVTGEITIDLLTTAKNFIIPMGSEVIGRRNAISIKTRNMNDDQRGVWRKLLIEKMDEIPGNDYITVRVHIDRKTTPNAVNPAQYSTKLGGSVANLNLTRAQFIEFIEGESDIFIFDESVATEPIDENSTKRYDYTVYLEVVYNNGEGQQTVTSNTVKDYTSYIRPKNPPEYIGYTSNHVEYGEIKHERPNNEEFNAMAGVPSNKRLYYAIGGSEFIVDVELEYIENEKSVWRTYRSYFDGTESEYKNSIKGKGDIAVLETVGGRVHYHGYVEDGRMPGREGYWERTYNHLAGKPQKPAPQPLTLCWKAASDGINRCYTEDYYWVTTVDIPATHGCTGDPCTGHGGDKDGTYGGYYVYTMPDHAIDGPDCIHDLPPVEDNWRQRVTYDYIKIIRAEVYKLTAGKLEKTGVVLGSDNDEMNATIQQGNHTIWFNIAQRNANGDDVAAQSSKHGRIRYSLEEAQHDTVEWYEGVRSATSDGLGRNGVQVNPKNGAPRATQGGGHKNSWAKGVLYTRPKNIISDKPDAHKNFVTGMKELYSATTDSVDMETPEWKKFNERRNLPVVATIVSDFLILQTSSGDQSVMYFEKSTPQITAQEQFPDVKATKEEMWDNNPLSAAKWSEDHIYLGSYNGNYKQTGTSCSSNKKFHGYHKPSDSYINNCSGSTNHVATRLDNLGAGVNGSFKRPARPTKQLQIYETKDIVPTTPNDDYRFGDSTAFYERILTYKSANPYKDYTGLELRANLYTPSNQPKFSNRLGLIFNAPYSPNHDRINDIVIHTPTSSQDAMIIANPQWLDQRAEYPEGGAASMIDKENNDRVAFENSLATPNLFTDAVKIWTTTTTTITPKKTLEYEKMKPGGTKSRDFNYTGGVQTFTAPVSGTYTLELWGAQGGGATGGKGGYTKTTAYLSKGETIYVVVGGQGTYGSSGGGYNGGGNGGSEAYGGGGATHIAKATGLLSSLSNNRHAILAVAGGGGGEENHGGYGGNGGGLTGGTGYGGQTGGNNNTGGHGSNQNGSFGKGGNGYRHGGGGGGGYHGGGGGYDCYESGGGGASFYHGGVSNGTSTAGVHSGHGKAKISWKEEPEKIPGESFKIIDEGTPRTVVTRDYSEVGDSESYKGYTWEDLFGPNWRNYVTTTTSTEEFNENKSSKVTKDRGTVYLAKSWTFDSGLEGFTKGTTNISHTSGKLRVYYDEGEGQPAVDRYFVSSDNLNIQNANKDKDVLEIKLKTVEGGKGIKIAFTTTTNSNFNTNIISDNLINPISKDSNGYETYRINLNHNNWTGTIKQLRIYIATGRPKTDVYIDHIKIFTSSSNDTGNANPVDFAYTGNVQTFVVPSTGTYQLEVWGAQGGGTYGGKGGYSKGSINLSKGQTIYVYVGGSGNSGGFNGGGESSYNRGGGGTDIRVNGTALDNRVIVAGGGGGAGNTDSSVASGGYGGGLVGESGSGRYGGPGGGATQTSGGTSSGGTRGGVGTLGQGGKGAYAGTSRDAGGGGGGYYGGAGGSTDYPSFSDNDDYGGGGGSGYIGGVTNGQTIAGNQTMPNPLGGTQTGHSGNGYARITPLEVEPDEVFREIETEENRIHIHTHQVIERTTVHVELVKRDLHLFPDYMPDGTYNPVKLGFGVGQQPKSPLDDPVETSGGGKIYMATFIVLDREFKVYFPNRGDFAQQPNLRASTETTTIRGAGYYNSMDTTEYTDSKYVKFSFAVIFNGVLYPSNTWIKLPLEQEYFDFYNVLANDEASAAKVEFQTIAINAPGLVNDNWEEVTNKRRYKSLESKHGSYKRTYVDILGRIGNMAIVDTDDFRFSNLFKNPVAEDEWIVEGVIKKVNPTSQRAYYGDKIDIRGVDKDSTLKLNTYGIQKFLELPRLSLPINPMDNISPALHEEYIKVGYDIYGSIQTIGNYADGAIRIIPYYYKIEFNNGGDDVELIPLDVYQLVEGKYVPVNRYGAADNGYVPPDIYTYPMIVDWVNESGRFNFTVDEADVTALASEFYGKPITGLVPNDAGILIEGVTEMRPLETPKGSFINLGNAQRIVVDPTLRTFIGNTETYGEDKNPGNVLPYQEYHYKGQKWYFKLGLPANAVFVKAGADMSDGNADKAIEEIKQGEGIVMMTADIVAVGTVYALRYNQYGNTQFTVKKNDKEITIDLTKAVNEGLQPFIALYDLETTAVIDVETQGRH